MYAPYIGISVIIVAVCVYCHASESALENEDLEDHEVTESEVKPNFFLHELKGNPCYNESTVIS